MKKNKGTSSCLGEIPSIVKRYRVDFRQKKIVEDNDAGTFVMAIDMARHLVAEQRKAVRREKKLTEALVSICWEAKGRTEIEDRVCRLCGGSYPYHAVSCVLYKQAKP